MPDSVSNATQPKPNQTRPDIRTGPYFHIAFYHLMKYPSGIFKTKRTQEGTLTHDPPRFQAFQCIHSPDAGLGEGGQTLLTNTNDLMQLGLTEAQRKWLEDKTFSIFTPANKVFGGDHLKLPLVMKNDGTGHDVLRWHENW